MEQKSCGRASNLISDSGYIRHSEHNQLQMRGKCYGNIITTIFDN